jgi:hypothetical protein
VASHHSIQQPSLVAFSWSTKAKTRAWHICSSSALVIPDGNTGAVKVELENVNNEGFLGIEFMPNGSVRAIDQQITNFGTYTRNQVLLVQVTLTIGNTDVKARITLSGAGASGQSDRTITIAPLLSRAHNFEEVTLSVDFPGTGTFHAQNIVVTRKS